MNTLIPFRWMGVFIYLMSLVGAWGQSTLSPQPAQQTSPVVTTGPTTISTTASPVLQGQATLQAYKQEQAALKQEMQTLVAQGATPQQLAAWRQQNAAQFAALQQQAEAMSATPVLQLQPTNRQPNIPANASQALKDFLTTQALLANALAQINNQIVQQAGAPRQSVTSAQISQTEQQQMQLFQQQHASDLQLQTQRAQTLANESAQTPLPTPPHLRLPPNASPQLQAYLTARYQLMQEQVQLQNQYANAAPSVRQAAMQQWQQQNAGAIQQLNQQAQNLSPATITTQN